MEADPRLRASTQHGISSSTPSNTNAPLSHSRYNDLSQSPHTSYRAEEPSAHDAGPVDSPPGTARQAPPREESVDENANTDPLADLKRPRACEACRQLKVRCDVEPNHPSGSCKRCAKANRRCVVTVPTRKRQKKADSRVAELEKRIDSLTASLHASRARSQAPATTPDQPQPQTQGGSPSGIWLGQFPTRNGMGHRQINEGAEGAGSPSGGLAGRKRQMNGDIKSRFGRAGVLAPLPARPNSPTDEAPSSTNPGSSNNAESVPCFESVCPTAYDSVPKATYDHEYTDVIDREILDVDTAKKAFDRYTEEMAPLIPFVVFPEGTVVADVRRTKPILFLAILSGSIPAFRPNLQVPLVSELHRVFADRIVIRGQKSLELVQALLVATFWYSPPDHYEELKFYQFIHMAVVIGMELGMNRRSEKESKSRGMWREIMGRKVPQLRPECLETRRAWLGCYFASACAAMSLRRPLLTRWNSYMDECMDMLRNSPEALPSDTALVFWVRLAHLGEEIGFQFSMDDPVTNVSITDSKIQYALKGFERQLEDWRNTVPLHIYSPVMEHFENVVNVYMHEIALHVDHNIDDFKPPFISDLSSDQPDMGSRAHVEALTSCLTSIHRTYDILCSIEPAKLHSLPVVHFVRTSYATVALIRLYNAATSPGSKLSHVFNPPDFRVEHYFDKVLQHLKVAAEIDAGRTVTKFLAIVTMLRTWFLKRKEGKHIVALPHFFQRPGDCIGNHEQSTSAAAPAASGDSQDRDPVNSRSTSLRVLSEVALGNPDGSQQEGQLQSSDTVAHSDEILPNVNTIATNPVAPSHPATTESTARDSATSEYWQHLATQPMIPFQTAPAAPSILEYQQAYAQNQALIQANQLAGQDQIPPQDQQQLQDFMTEIDMMTSQPDGFAMWGDMWDDMFGPTFPMEGNGGPS